MCRAYKTGLMGFIKASSESHAEPDSINSNVVMAFVWFAVVCVDVC